MLECTPGSLPGIAKLFDFVSPFVVYFAVLSYFLFIAYAIYLDLFVYHNTSLSKPCLTAIGSVTLVYALNAFIIYKYLYGRKNPLVTRGPRAHDQRDRESRRLQQYRSRLVHLGLRHARRAGRSGTVRSNHFPGDYYSFLYLFSVTAPRRPEVDGPGSSRETVSRNLWFPCSVHGASAGNISLYPAQFSRYESRRTACPPTASCSQCRSQTLYGRFLTRYRAVNWGIAALGLLLVTGCSTTCAEWTGMMGL